jgi:hypothetical protein
VRFQRTNPAIAKNSHPQDWTVIGCLVASQESQRSAFGYNYLHRYLSGAAWVGALETHPTRTASNPAGFVSKLFADVVYLIGKRISFHLWVAIWDARLS